MWPEPERMGRAARATGLLAAATGAIVLLVPAGASGEAGGSPTRFGAFAWPAPWEELDAVDNLAAAVDQPVDVVQWYQPWQRGSDTDGTWWPQMVASVADSGRTPLITWEPHGVDLDAVTAGAWDDYLDAWARGVAAHDGPVYLRPFPEMNGDWHDWNGDPAGVVAAWRHVVARFEAAGADNVRWVWSPYASDWPDTAANRLERYYPGDAYVDVLAIDGFNWGRRSADDIHYWRSFHEVFAEAYARVTALGDQPVWLTEVGSAEVGGDKAAWLEAMATRLAHGYDRVRALVWFNADKERDWRLDSSPAALAAARAGLARITATNAGGTDDGDAPRDASDTAAVTRLAGSTRFATAVAMAQRGYPDGAQRVYVARGDAFADALATSGLVDAPVLLVPRCGELPAVVADELARLAPRELVVLGGRAALCSSMVEQAGAAAGGSAVQRLGGDTRFATAASVARHGHPDGAQRVYVARGDAFADALAASGLVDAPVLLVPRCAELPAVVADELARLAPRELVVLGGRAAVCDDVVQRAVAAAGGPAVARATGATRFATAVAMAQRGYPDGAQRVYVARGDAFADALATSGLVDAPVLLVPRCGELPAVVADELARLAPQELVVLGGSRAVCASLVDRAVAAGGLDAG